MTAITPQPIYVVRLRPEPHVTDTIKALRHALKELLRMHGVRCLQIDEEKS